MLHAPNDLLSLAVNHNSLMGLGKPWIFCNYCQMKIKIETPTVSVMVTATPISLTYSSCDTTLSPAR